jgi:hypothetical protein
VGGGSDKCVLVPAKRDTKVAKNSFRAGRVWRWAPTLCATRKCSSGLKDLQADTHIFMMANSGHGQIGPEVVPKSVNGGARWLNDASHPRSQCGLLEHRVLDGCAELERWPMLGSRTRATFHLQLASNLVVRPLLQSRDSHLRPLRSSGGHHSLHTDPLGRN